MSRVDYCLGAPGANESRSAGYEYSHCWNVRPCRPLPQGNEFPTQPYETPMSCERI